MLSLIYISSSIRWKKGYSRKTSKDGGRKRHAGHLASYKRGQKYQYVCSCRVYCFYCFRKKWIGKSKAVKAKEIILVIIFSLFYHSIHNLNVWMEEQIKHMTRTRQLLLPFFIVYHHSRLKKILECEWNGSTKKNVMHLRFL